MRIALTRLAKTPSYAFDLLKMDSTETFLKSLQAIVTSAAIVAGGIWFLMRGETRPNASLDHSFSFGSFESTESVHWVRAEVEIKNTGRRPLEIRRHKHILRTVYPVTIGVMTERNLPDYFPNRSRLEWPAYDRFQWGYEFDHQLESYQQNSADDIRLESGEAHSVYLDFVVSDEPTRFVLESFVENQGSPDGKGWKLSTIFSRQEKDNEAI